jgi:cell division protein FtsB
MMSNWDAMADVILMKAMREGRSAELLEKLYDGCAVTIDPETKDFVFGKFPNQLETENAALKAEVEPMKELLAWAVRFIKCNHFEPERYSEFCNASQVVAGEPVVGLIYRKEMQMEVLQEDNNKLKAEVERLRREIEVSKAKESKFAYIDFVEKNYVRHDVYARLRAESEKLRGLPKKVFVELKSLMISPAFSDENYVEWWDIVDVFAKHGIEITDGEL